MTLHNLQDVYKDQVQDLYSACKQSRKVTGKLSEKAADAELRAALKAGEEGIEAGLKTLEQICDTHGIDPNGEHCKGMEGLVKEAEAHVLEQAFGDDATRDAMIITQYQRMVHYALAGYGCLVTFAKRLELHDDAQKLNTQLDETYDGDRRMSDIAMNGVNLKAA